MSKVFAAAFLLILSAGFILAYEESDHPRSFKKGEIIDPVVSNRFEGQSYALYVPANYDPAKKWPILYCFDPVPVGKRPVELFSQAAEKYGYIIASSNTFRANDPTFDVVPSLKAIWEDTHQWFSIDEKRIFTSGFSGGARIAWAIASMNKGQVAGVIGSGAGFSPQYPPAKDLPFLYYGTVGNTDFNFQEMMQLDRKLDSLQITHVIEIFNGRHQWAPQDLCTASIEWMELQIMKKGLKTKDNALIDLLYKKRIDQAESEQSHGDEYEAMRHYKAIAGDFTGLKDVSSIAQKAVELQNSKDMKSYLKEQERVEREEAAYQQKAISALGKIHSADRPLPSTGEVLRDLEISDLKRKAAKKDDSQETILSRRLLETVLLQTYFFLPSDLIRKKEYHRAIQSMLVASEIAPERPAIWYNMAAVYAQSGDKKMAIQTLQKAIDKGFADYAMMEKDPDLQSLRDQPFFQDLIKRLKEKSPQTAQH